MTDYTTDETTQEIPYGYCHCGCGEKTNLCPQTDPQKGWIRGEPKKFIIGHRIRLGKFLSPEHAFWDHVIPGEADACWPWNGSLDDKGYGTAQWIGQKRRMGAHRLSYLLHCGLVLDNLQVLHKCDNPRCVNPNHLFLGTIADNMKDKTAKGRQQKGEKVPNAKLTENDVRLIRQMTAEGYTRKKIAARFSVSRSAIIHIIRGNTWRHVK